MHAIEVDVEALFDNPYQPRESMEEEALHELSESIRLLGLLHPPLVVLQEEGVFRILAGHRRVAACRKIGLKTIPVWCGSSNEPSFAAQASLVENLQRSDLNPLEIAKALSKLQKEFGYTHEVLAQIIGKKRVTVTHFLRLLILDPQIQEAVAKSHLTMGHAKCLASLSFENQRLWMKKIIQEGLSVHLLEKKLSKPRLSIKAKAPESIEKELVEKLIQHFQLKAQASVDQQGGGWVKLYFERPEDLWRLWEVEMESNFDFGDKRSF
jgi:ParB family chromosome partitioning protein